MVQEENKKLEEHALPDDYPIYADYFYVVEGLVYRSDFHDITVGELKKHLSRQWMREIKRITNCDIAGRGLWR